MIYIRSALFNVVFYVNLILFLVLGSGFYFTPRKWSIRALQVWARSSLFWLRVIAGIRMEVRGREHIPQGACLVAGKHQSFWETFAILPLPVPDRLASLEVLRATPSVQLFVERAQAHKASMTRRPRECRAWL